MMGQVATVSTCGALSFGSKALFQLPLWLIRVFSFLFSFFFFSLAPENCFVGRSRSHSFGNGEVLRWAAPDDGYNDDVVRVR